MCACVTTNIHVLPFGECIKCKRPRIPRTIDLKRGHMQELAMQIAQLPFKLDSSGRVSVHHLSDNLVWELKSQLPTSCGGSMCLFIVFFTVATSSLCNNKGLLSKASVSPVEVHPLTLLPIFALNPRLWAVVSPQQGWISSWEKHQPSSPTALIGLRVVRLV